MYYKQLAIEFFDFMVSAHDGPIVPPDPKDYSRGELGILIYLIQKDGVTSGLLSEALQVSTGRIASALKSLEKKGLVVRRMDSTDKRKVNVYITEDGKREILKKHEEAIEQMVQSLQKLGKEDAKLFVELSKRFLS